MARIERDFYKTPLIAINSLLNNFQLKGKTFLDPCAGDGRIGQVVKTMYPHMEIDQVEIRKEEKAGLKKYGNVFIGDFLNFTTDKDYNTIMTNPPFSLAVEIIEHCFEIATENTEIIMLLKLSFLESKDRFNFWQEYPVSKLFCLRDRPRFINNKTDFAAYAWFVWDNEVGNIKVI